MRSKMAGKEEDENKKKRVKIISGVIGMRESGEDQFDDDEEKGSLIPKDAEQTDGSESSNPGVNVARPKFKKNDPDSPKGGEEQLLSPKAALVAPDVTPDSMTEIDPSEVPGPSGATFSASDAARPAQPPSPAPSAPGSDQFTNTMDTLLGRNRSDGASRPPSMESVQTASALSPEAAAAMFASQAGDPLKPGQPMPEPVVGDGKKICEAFRRFC